MTQPQVTPLPKQGPKRKKSTAVYRKARFLVAVRSDGRCEAQLEGCTGWGEHAHHVRRRSQGGSDRPANLKWVCGMCHLKIHAQPARAFELGLLARSGPVSSAVVRVERVTPDDAA